MNPIEMLRTLVEGLAEGERVKKFGYGYREKARGQELENQKAELEVADLPETMKQRHSTAQIAITAEEERHLQDIQDAKDAGLNPSPEAIAGLKAAREKAKREADMARVNAQTDREKVATEAARQGLPSARPTLDTEALDAIAPRWNPDSSVGPQPGPTNASIEILTKKMEEDARLRQARESATIRMQQQQGAPLDPAAVKSVAGRVKRGEISITEGRQLLGGVKSGAGAALTLELGNDAVIPAPVRKDLQSIQTTRNIVDQMEALMNNIINATDPVERAKNTLLLEQFGQTTGTLLSRGFGERGVVTDRDVARATGLVPGWKATNFAPEYARREIALLHEVLDRNENGVMGGYFQTRDQTGTRTGLGGPTGSPTPGAGASVVHYDKNGQRIQ